LLYEVTGKQKKSSDAINQNTLARAFDDFFSDAHFSSSVKTKFIDIFVKTIFVYYL
jgi:hypothetical protein